jgi:hypothetical protein
VGEARFVIVAGTRLAGKVDVTAQGHVATRVVHVWFVPLIPLSSWFVTEAGGRCRELAQATGLRVEPVQ